MYIRMYKLATMHILLTLHSMKGPPPSYNSTGVDGWLVYYTVIHQTSTAQHACCRAESYNKHLCRVQVFDRIHTARSTHVALHVKGTGLKQ